MTEPQDTAPAIVEHELPNALKKNFPVWLRGALLLTGVAVLVLFIFYISTYEEDKTPPAPNNYEIQGMCEDWVAGKLKSPSTAKFSNHTVRAAGTNSWAVAGDVDSQNGFGAMIRSPWTCSISLDGETFRGSVNF